MHAHATITDKRALVIGASMAGLLAARVLADYFQEVIIIEKDILPEGAIPRKGVPQGHHVHNLLAKGDTLMDRWFPELFQDLLAHGGVSVDWGEDTRWYHHGVWKCRNKSGVRSYLMSRPLLEWRVRTHLLRLPNVHIWSGYAVVNLTTSEHNDNIEGVNLSNKTAPTALPEFLATDLVVDCSGRGSRLSAWLQALGYGKVPISQIQVDVAYATRIMKEPVHPPDFKVLAHVSPHPIKRSAVMFRIENKQWMVTLFGYHGEHPPTEEKGWMEFARSLEKQEVQATISSFTPLSKITMFKFPFTLRRHFEKMRRFPNRLLALGDSVCSFNPIYGQGMTSAAVQAAALEKGLQQCEGMNEKKRTQSLKRLRKEISKAVEPCWQAVASEDFRHPETVGDKAAAATLINWYTYRIHRLSEKDPQIMRRFLQVMHMQKPVNNLFDFRTILKVLTTNL